MILTINAGSSSVKYAVFDAQSLTRHSHGQVDRVGGDAQLIHHDGSAQSTTALGQVDHKGALAAIIDRLSQQSERPVQAIGHRVVHGGPDRKAPAELTVALRDELARYSPFAPLHQPHNLACAAATAEIYPQARQVACFDTAFHRDHPWVNDTFALPRDLYDEGVRRYGFHGLSYEYISGRLAEAHPDLARGRVIVAHLGNGASICAMSGGRSVGSSMGFSALDGLPMGTRCGQIDPGVLLYLMEQKHMDAAQISGLLYKQSGLLGLSGLSNDMRRLEASDDPKAAEAIDYFVFRLAREIGAMAAVLGGVDGLVFTGGIGENSALVRGRACANLGFLGIQIDPEANAQSAPSIGGGAVQVLVLPTDEQALIARAARAVLVV